MGQGMDDRPDISSLQEMLQVLAGHALTPLDLLPDGSFAERVISLLLTGPPPCASTRLAAEFSALAQQFRDLDPSLTRVVVFGGGTGLSNIIGGDSRRHSWPERPFTGLKEIFPRISSIVCVTDDGGSTGELLKDLPLIALGDLRHVLLASVRRQELKGRYGLDDAAGDRVAGALHGIINYRFISCPPTPEHLLADTAAWREELPRELDSFISGLIERLFRDPRLKPTLRRPQCLGNLLLASTIYRHLDPALDSVQLIAGYQLVRTATMRGLAEFSSMIGVRRGSVLPCTTTISRLQMLYGNGVLVTSEYKSGQARRGYPVDRVQVEFCRQPYLLPEVVELIREADILVFAPGSLYTSIIPILQVPGIADAVRANTGALKVLTANIWVQKGETDVARDAPDRKFYVSDLILAYHRNIPGGVRDLFSHVLGLDLGDIPGSVLQRYALEDKEPIYLDRSRVHELGFEPVEARIFSRELLRERGVIQHDPDALATSIRVLWGLKETGFLACPENRPDLPGGHAFSPVISGSHEVPCYRYEAICTQFQYLSMDHLTESSGYDKRLVESERRWLLDRVIEIVWRHPDILLEHLRHIRGITLVDPACWNRCQQWDNIFSFYDPTDGRIRIRRDQTEDLNRFEMVFLVALGQSLLGNYAQKKYMENVYVRGEQVGRMFCLLVREWQQVDSFLSAGEVDIYLRLARMRRSTGDQRLYTRVINDREGFTPPGLLFGLFYAWYLDNRFAANIEYKMSIMRNEITNLIPEQIRLVQRRSGLIRFFREHVFRHRIATTMAPEQ